MIALDAVRDALGADHGRDGSASRSVAFLPRHGLRHEVAPHAVNSRANLWALRELGRAAGSSARARWARCAPTSAPGDLVVLDQLIDRTWGRDDTYLDGEVVEHVSFADPYCPELRAALVEAGGRVVGRGACTTAGTVVVVQGPRFSTRAESRWYSTAGVDVINMTQYPEAYLARELGLCYAGLALVTDRDVGRRGRPRQPAGHHGGGHGGPGRQRGAHPPAAGGRHPGHPASPGLRVRGGGAPSLLE